MTAGDVVRAARQRWLTASLAVAVLAVGAAMGVPWGPSAAWNWWRTAVGVGAAALVATAMLQPWRWHFELPPSGAATPPPSSAPSVAPPIEFETSRTIFMAAPPLEALGIAQSPSSTVDLPLNDTAPDIPLMEVPTSVSTSYDDVAQDEPAVDAIEDDAPRVEVGAMDTARMAAATFDRAATAPSTTVMPPPVAVVSIGDAPTQVLTRDTVVTGPLRAVRLIEVGDTAGVAGEFVLECGCHVIGRADTATLTIRNPQVSRRHAIIVVTPEQATVEDCTSAHGTYVNLRPVDQDPVVLRHGDTLALGSVEFKVNLVW